MQPIFAHLNHWAKREFLRFVVWQLQIDFEGAKPDVNGQHGLFVRSRSNTKNIMTEIVVALITALTGSTAWTFYTRHQKNRFREREQLIVELREWRDDWKQRAEELDRKVQNLCVENGKLRAQIQKLETQLQHLTK